jgi:serine/threonine-protein kinase
MPPRADVPGDLLFGLLALQAGLIDQSALVAAFHTWCRDRARPMAEILVDREDLDPGEREVVAGLVAAHLRRHGGDRDESLAALRVDASAVEGLADVGGPDLEATLSRTGLGPSHHPVDDVARLPFDPDGAAGASATVDYAASSEAGPRYRIVRKLGAGGLGVVFVAVDALLHREVALKQVRPDRGDDPQDRARFLVEAEITARLEHPGIVPVHDLGGGDGRPYYVMRLVRGDTLKDAIAVFHDDPALRNDPPARALALQKLLRRFLDVCDAVDYAHARGVLHRDIKPSNVVVGKHGETILLDWGLAKAVGRHGGRPAEDERTLVPSSGSDSAETQAGWAMGTPSFMSPEQARGDLDRIGPRSDVYGLGATLYHLLAGRKPFAGPDVAAIVAAVEEGDFPPPRSVDPTVDRALEAICLKAMARRPEFRYASARELADEVERWLADAPVAAWPEPAAVRLRRWARRHRPMVASAAVLLVMTTLASIGAALLLDRHSRRIEAEQLLTSSARAEADANFQKTLDAGDAMLTRVFDERLASVPQMESLRHDLARDAAAFFDASLRQRPDNPAARFTAATVFRRVANIDRQLNQPGPARANYDRAIELLSGLCDQFADRLSYRDQLAETLIDEAEMIRLQGQFREAEPFYLRALGIVRALRESDPASDGYRRTEATNRSDFGAALLGACRFDEARAMFDQSAALRKPLADAAGAGLADRLLMIMTLTNLAEVRRREGHPSEASSSAQDAVRRARTLRDQDPANNDRRYVLALALGELARDLAAEAVRLPQAHDAIDQSIELLRKLADDFPKKTIYRLRLAQALAGRGEIREAAGRPMDAEADLTAARAAIEPLVAASPETVEYRGQLGLILDRLAARALARGDSAGAAAIAQDALDARAANPDACTISAAIDRLRAAGGAAPLLPKP